MDRDNDHDNNEMDVEEFIRDIGADRLVHSGGRNENCSSLNELDDRSSDLSELKNAWVTERMAPDILPYKQELLSIIRQRINEQMEFIEERSISLNSDVDVKIHLLIVESELERIKFLVRGYLRARLAKLDKHAIHIVQSIDDYGANLSEGEKSYVARQVSILGKLHGSQFLDGFPQELRAIDDSIGSTPVVQKPDLNKTVCVFVNETIPTPILVGNDELDMEKGNVYAIRYSAVEPYIRDGSIRLI